MMPYNVSDFAKSQLHQAGWVQGKGLGKNEDGMSEAIKVSIKADKTGVGHDPGEQFTFHWWEHAFKKSAQNIKVKENKNGVEVETKSETEIASTRKQNKKLMKQNLLYGSFVKSGILENGKLQPTKPAGQESDSSDSDSESSSAKKSKILTDEELLAACGGRTAHKFARHGVKSSAKLARLQEQEKIVASGDSSENHEKKKKKKTKNSGTILPGTELDNSDEKKLKQTEKSRKQKNRDLKPDLFDEELPRKSTKKKLKKNKKRKLEKDLFAQETANVTEPVKSKKKKKKSMVEVEHDD